MKIKIFYIFLITLLFNEIISSINIVNFEEITYPSGISEYSYNFTEFNSTDDKDAYFFFNFTNVKNIQFKIIDEDKIEENIEIAEANWTCFKIKNLKAQEYIFQIINNDIDTGEFLFIDSTQEIYTNLEKFIYLNFSLKQVEKKPLPLIFTLETTQDDLYYDFNIYSNSYSEGDWLLYICELNTESECQYMGIRAFHFQLGKNYKIKMTWFTYYNQYYYFKKLNIQNLIVKDIYLGFNKFNIDSNIRNYCYFIYNAKKYKNIYRYIYPMHDYAFLSEEQKNLFPNNMNSINYKIATGGDQFSLIEISTDYLIFKIYSEDINIYLANYYTLINSDNDFVEEYLKDSFAVLDITKFRDNKVPLSITSSNKNILSYSSDSGTNFITLNSNGYLYINSSIEKTTVRGYEYSSYYRFKLTRKNDINKFLATYGPDSIFMRISTHSVDTTYNSTYLFDIDDKYYFFIKKYYGNTDIYKCNNKLDSLNNIVSFQHKLQTYDELSNYKSINNRLIIISGYQFLSYYMNYNSLFDFYFQKVDDLQIVNINIKNFQFNNLVKLFNPNKEYLLNFTVDHLIKLDNNFLDAEIKFIDQKNQQEYILNGDNKIIKILNSNNIKVISDKNALIYFYKRIVDDSKIKMVIFDNKQKRKNMKFNIKNKNNEKINIFLIKDFGFEGYYPMLSKKYWDEVVSKNSISTIYIENLYDQLEFELDDEEKYIIYIFDSYDENGIPILNSGNYEISEITYVNNLLTPDNKYNFELISSNQNGSIIFNIKNKWSITYQFYTCEAKTIKFKTESSSGYIELHNYPYEEIIRRNQTINIYVKNDTFSHLFESDKEFLFSYFIIDKYEENNKKENTNAKIISIEEIDKNKLLLIFDSYYENKLTKYHIVLAKKDTTNNAQSFSNPCHLTNLMIGNPDKIIVKTIFEESDNSKIMTTIDFTKLNLDEDTDIVVSIISNSGKSLFFYSPREFKIENKAIPEIHPDKEIKYDENNSVLKLEYHDKIEREKMIYIKLRAAYTYLYFISPYKVEMVDLIFSHKTYFYIIEPNVYYIKIMNNYEDFGGSFICHISENIQTIDLSKKYYYHKTDFGMEFKMVHDIIKINNITEDRYVYFNYEYATTTNIKTNPIEICNDLSDECSTDIILYKFSKGNNYTINIYIGKIYQNDYICPSYFFFPILDDTIESIDLGYYVFSNPKIFIVNLQNKKSTVYYLCENRDYLYITESKNEISLNDLNYLSRSSYNPDTFNKNNLYGLLLIIPSINVNPSKLIIFNETLFAQKEGEYIINAGKPTMIYFNRNMYSKNNIIYEEDDEEYPNFINPLDNYNPLATISSSTKNLKIVMQIEPKEKTDFVIQNYYAYPIYSYENENNNILTIKKYGPRFTFFGVVNNDLFNMYIKEILDLTNMEKVIDLEKINSVNIRINSDELSIYEFFNFYFYDFNENTIFYFKNYYGETNLYEYNNINLINNKDFSVLTKPIQFYENKDSIVNKISSFKNNELLSLYLTYNSIFDIYFEIDDNKTDINIFPEEINKFNNGAKYLKRGVEYNFNFAVDHLFKLEPEFDAEVSIYNNKNKITLSKNNLTGLFTGNNVKIKSSDNALIYFYSKILSNFKQIKIEPKYIEKNFEINIEYSGDYTDAIIDFGFEGYNPTNCLRFNFRSLKHVENIYIENIYDRLKTKLVEGEYLYLYVYSYFGRDFSYKINYTENIRHKNNEYNFFYIQKNTTEKSLIVNKGNKGNIIYQAYFCESPHNIKLYHYEQDSSKDTILEFNNETTIIEQKINSGPSVKLNFESDEDFIFSYSLVDKTDKKVKDCEKWNNQRKVLTDLTIEEIVKTNYNDEKSNLFTIKFKPNYKLSSTRYIIVIAPRDKNNSLKNFSNICYFTKLITEKTEGVLIKTIYDIGENDLIEINVDISEILDIAGNYIVNILSQELRFEKKLKCYTPIQFSYEIETPIKIELDQEQKFNIKKDIPYFDLVYEKKSEKKEIFFLYYKLDIEEPMTIKIQGPNNFDELFNIRNIDGYFHFIFNEGGSYKIVFDIENKNINNEDDILATFKIVSSEYPFRIDLNKAYINFNEINIEGNEPPSLKLYTDILEQDFIKKIKFENLNFGEINKIVSIRKNEAEFENLNFNYYFFENNSNYNININFNKKRKINIY